MAARIRGKVKAAPRACGKTFETSNFQPVELTRDMFEVREAA